MHDWTQVEPTIFHHFHQQWSSATVALNAGLLPPGLSALIEQHTGDWCPMYWLSNDGDHDGHLLVERQRSLIRG